jgi:hypothetical protein
LQACVNNPSGYRVATCLNNNEGCSDYTMNEPPENGAEAEDEAANDRMTPAMRLLDLQTKHRALDVKIQEMYDYPYQNQILLQRLKKEKLRLKDSIARLKNDMIPDLNA